MTRNRDSSSVGRVPDTDPTAQQRRLSGAHPGARAAAASAAAAGDPGGSVLDGGGGGLPSWAARFAWWKTLNFSSIRAVVSAVSRWVR